MSDKFLVKAGLALLVLLLALYIVEAMLRIAGGCP